jgi:hypothetical protein
MGGGEDLLEKGGFERNGTGITGITGGTGRPICGTGMFPGTRVHRASRGLFPESSRSLISTPVCASEAADCAPMALLPLIVTLRP